MERRAARIENDVPLRRDLIAMQAEGFAQTAFDAVADHGSAESARNGESNARARLQCGLTACLAEGGEQRAGDAESVIINMPEVGRA